METTPYPFVKNRYFTGKLLQAEDFTREQACYDAKTDFHAMWSYGPGIAAGLQVQRVDGESLLLEPGFAVDGGGRAVVVDRPELRRLRAVEGFAELTGTLALLTIEAADEPQDAAFCAFAEEGETQQYGSVREGFRLRLRPQRPWEPQAADRALLSDAVLYEDEELRVRQVIPRVFSAEGTTRLRLVVERFGAGPLELGVRYAPDVPGFTHAETGGAPLLEASLKLTGAGATLTLPLARRGEAAPQAVVVSLKRDGLTLTRRGETLEARDTFCETFPIVRGDPLAALAARLRSLPLDAFWAEGAREIPVALLRLVRGGGACMLDEVLPVPEEGRAQPPFWGGRLARCAPLFAPPATQPQPSVLADAPAPTHGAPAGPRVATGTIELSVGLGTKRDEILYTEETAHGLGPGAVYVAFGVEEVTPAAGGARNRTALLFGEHTLFAGEGGGYQEPLQKAVCVHADKGTFELALRPRAPVQQPVLRLRWFAWGAEAAGTRAPAGTLLRLEPDVQTAAPGMVIGFQPVFSEGGEAACDFSVEGERAGFITRDGVYTAPEAEGLYQVRACVHGYPEQRVSAFVIVRRGQDGHGSDGV